MKEERPHDTEAARLSEDAAHRLLLRAIELDDARGSETTVRDLREVARETGISASAFEAAFRELLMQPPAVAPPSPATKPRGLFSRLWERMRDRVNPPTIGDAVVSNAMAATLFWISAFLLTRITHGFGWQAMDGTILLSCILGVGIARKLHARLVELGLMGLVATQAAELAMHLLFGIRAVQGGPTHFAVMIAGVLGATIAWGMSGTHHRPADPVGGGVGARSKVASEPVSAGAPPEAERHIRWIQRGPPLWGASFARSRGTPSIPNLDVIATP